uniref:Uncharacterized protein n=1 Tax=Anguilla anguilla TaxID=7936 RepID=A0A0E9TFL7_ANGAN
MEYSGMTPETARCTSTNKSTGFD